MAWHDLAARADLDDKDVIGVKHGEVDVAIYRLGGEILATANICTHQFAFLSEGYVVDDCIECPLHQGLFDIRTGQARGGVVKIDLKTFAVRVEGDRILVDID